jgi:hypothetical protein
MNSRPIWGLRPWLLGALALVSGLVPSHPAEAQTTACQQAALQTVTPLLATANNFNPSGVFPVGFAPLNQPFATNASEYALYGYPVPGYAAGGARPPYSVGYPRGFPPAVMPVDSSPTDPATASALAPPDPRLTASAILDRALSDGTFQALSPDQQTALQVQLGQLQQSETAQRVAQANLQQQAVVNMVNTRRVPFDLAAQYQERARNWHDSYTLYAQTALNLVQATCNPSTGLPATLPPGGSGLGNITNLAQFCFGGGTVGGICSGFR